MSEVTEQDDRNRDLALFLHAACRRDTTFRQDALRGISPNTIWKRLVQRDVLEHEFARDTRHQTIMLKAGIRLGILQAA